MRKQGATPAEAKNAPAEKRAKDWQNNRESKRRIQDGMKYLNIPSLTADKGRKSDMSINIDISVSQINQKGEEVRISNAREQQSTDFRA